MFYIIEKYLSASLLNTRIADIKPEGKTSQLGTKSKQIKALIEMKQMKNNNYDMTSTSMESCSDIDSVATGKFR